MRVFHAPCHFGRPTGHAARDPWRIVCTMTGVLVRSHFVRRVALAALLIGSIALPLSAQSRCCREPQWPHRAVYFQAGVHYADFYGDEGAMLVATRVNWQLRRWLLSEFGGYYTRPEDPGQEEVSVFGSEL